MKNVPNHDCIHTLIGLLIDFEYKDNAVLAVSMTILASAVPSTYRDSLPTCILYN